MFQQLTYTEYIGILKGIQHIYDEICDDCLEFSPLSIIREYTENIQCHFRDNPDSKLTPLITDRDIREFNLLLLRQIHSDEFIHIGDFFKIIKSLAYICSVICVEFEDHNLLDENHEYIDTKENFDIAENLIEDILY